MDVADRLGGYLKRVGVGPTMSKDLSREQARDAMAICLRREASDIRIGAFLLAARLKRETDDENRGFLDALRGAATIAEAPVPALVDLADPYDGAARHPPLGVFVAATLGAAGLPAVVHGVPEMGPKRGVTHEQVVAALGLSVDLSPSQAAARLATHGWAYLSARHSQPALHALDGIRDEICKRPALATLEKLVLPIRAAGSGGATHAVVGYVHKGYERLLRTLHREGGTASALVVKGPEGHTDLRVTRPTKATLFRPGGADEEASLDPAAAGIHATAEPKLDHQGPREIAALGLAALQGEPGPAAEAVVWTAGAILWSAGIAPALAEGVLRAQEALASGDASHALRRSRE